jgi:hypothetical protein
MSTGFLIKILSSDVFQTICAAILLILSIICLALDVFIVIMRCGEIFLMTEDDCGIGIGFFGIAAICIAFGTFSSYMLYRGWRAGYLRDLKIF